MKCNRHCSRKALSGKKTCRKHRDILVNNLRSSGKPRVKVGVETEGGHLTRGKHEDCVEVFYLVRQWQDGSKDIWKLVN